MFYPGYRVALTEDERARLTKMTSSGKTYARVFTHARILLYADRGPYGPRMPDREIAEALGCSELTAWRVRKTFVEEGLDAALYPKSSGPRARKLNGEQEAKLVALACSEPPDGRAVWTMQMLADKLVELEIIDSISDETVRVTLKKKSTEALAKEALGHPARGKWRIRRGHGRRARRLQASV
jgi:transposase